MTRIGFRTADGERWSAGEPVFHSGRRAFATVQGVQAGALVLQFDNGEYTAMPALVRRDPDGVALAMWNELRAIHGGLAVWFVDALANGATLTECKARLRAASALAKRD